jgi:hypothetical protein
MRANRSQPHSFGTGQRGKRYALTFRKGIGADDAVAQQAGSKRQTAVAAHRPAATAPQTAEPFWALFAQGSTSELGGR